MIEIIIIIFFISIFLKKKTSLNKLLICMIDQNTLGKKVKQIRNPQKEIYGGFL